MADAVMYLMLAVLVAALIMAIYAIFAAGRRARWLKRAGLALVVSLMLGGLGGTMLGAQQDEAARQAGGFATVEALRAAREVGADTKADYDALLAEQARAAEEEARRQAEAEAAAAARAEEEARRAAEQAAAEQAAEEAECRQDLRCWAERHSFEAGVSCAQHVERLAKYDHEWTDGWTQPKFTHFRWANRDSGAVTYLGDQIRFQNGLGNFIRHTYACDFDPTSGTVLRVMAEPGRL